jgi:hypothetical protein
MTNRRRLALSSAVVEPLVVGFCSLAHAQQPANSLPPGNTIPGWTISIAPYLWLPTINVNLGYNLPANLGGKLPADVSDGVADWFPHLDFATLFAAEARHDRFSVMTDFMYLKLSATPSHIRSLDFFGLPSMPISRSLETSVGTTLQTIIWTQSASYTIARGQWGNFDALVGFRLLSVSATTNYDLALSVTGPRGNGARFGGMGGVSTSDNIWNGIVGFRGQIQIQNSGFFLPYYFDIGAGGSNLTWQISGGIGYQTGPWAFSASYRYLSFTQGSDRVVHAINMGGPVLMASISF